MEDGTIEVGGQEYDVETVGEEMTHAIIGRSPVTVMSKSGLTRRDRQSSPLGARSGYTDRNKQRHRR
jgi:hypothetical protein